MNFAGSNAPKRFGPRDPKVQNPHRPTQRPTFALRQNSAGSGGLGSTQLMQRRTETLQNDTASRTRDVDATMEEVYKDLMILQQQQEEAAQQLEKAKQAKQRKQNALVQLETELQNLKYTNGQKRADLIRMREILSKGQRAFTAAEEGEKKARRDFQELERVIRIAVEAKRSVSVWERRHERNVENIKSKAKLCEKLVMEAEHRSQQLEANIKGMSDQFEQLDAALQNKQVEYQTIHQETADIMAESSLCENEVDSIKQARVRSRGEAEELERQLAMADKEVQRALAELEDEVTSVDGECNDARNEIEIKEAEFNDAKTSLQESFDELTLIQETEGHPKSEHPFHTNDSPVLDLARIQETVQSEAAAVGAEEEDKNKRQKELGELKTELASRQKELGTKCELSLELERTCEEQKQKETQRQENLKSFVDKFAVAKADAEQQEKHHADAVLKHGGALEASKARLAAAKQEYDKTQGAVDAAQQQLDQARATLGQEQQALEDIKSNNESGSLSELESKETELAKMIGKLQQKKDRLVAESQQTAKEESELAGTLLSETEMKAKAARILKEFPELESMNFLYDPSKTLDEQKKDYLRPLKNELKKRVDSAQKLVNELREAREREEAERLKLERAVKADRKRKEEARLKREQSLTVKADTAGDVGDNVERKKREKIMREKEKLRLKKQSDSFQPDTEPTSVAKPRDLSQSFSQVGKEDADKDNLSQKKVHWDGAVRSNAEREKPTQDLARRKSHSKSTSTASSAKSSKKQSSSHGQDVEKTAKSGSTSKQSSAIVKSKDTNKGHKPSGSRADESQRASIVEGIGKASSRSHSTNLAALEPSQGAKKHRSHSRDSDKEASIHERDSKKHRTSSSSDVDGGKKSGDDKDRDKRRSQSSATDQLVEKSKDDLAKTKHKSRPTSEAEADHRAKTHERDAEPKANSKALGDKAPQDGRDAKKPAKIASKLSDKPVDERGRQKDRTLSSSAKAQEEDHRRSSSNHSSRSNKPAAGGTSSVPRPSSFKEKHADGTKEARPKDKSTSTAIDKPKSSKEKPAAGTAKESQKTDKPSSKSLVKKADAPKSQSSAATKPRSKESSGRDKENTAREKEKDKKIATSLKPSYIEKLNSKPTSSSARIDGDKQVGKPKKPSADAATSGKDAQAKPSSKSASKPSSKSASKPSSKPASKSTSKSTDQPLKSVLKKRSFDGEGAGTKQASTNAGPTDQERPKKVRRRVPSGTSYKKKRGYRTDEEMGFGFGFLDD